MHLGRSLTLPSQGHYFLDALRGSTTKRLLRGEQSPVLAVRAKRTEEFMEKYDRPRDDELRTHYREHVIWIFVRKSKDQRWEFMTQVIWNEDSGAQAEWFTSALAYNTAEQAMRGGLLLGQWWIDAGKPEVIKLPDT